MALNESAVDEGSDEWRDDDGFLSQIVSLGRTEMGDES